MAQVSIFSPWKDASRRIAGTDWSVMAYVKCIADLGPAGGQADQATILSTAAASTVTIQIAEGGGALGNDPGINYTAMAAAAGIITYTDANANTVQELVNILNGVGAGQALIRRYRTALGDFPPAYALTANDILNDGAARNLLLGESHVGAILFADQSALAVADELWIGIGTAGGTVAGSGWIWPDYFEDIPGTSTVAGVSTPTRSSAIRGRKTEDTVTRRKQYRIVGFSMGAFWNATAQFDVLDIDSNVIWTEALGVGAAIAFQDRSDVPIEGPVGSPLFCRFTGTNALTNGFFSVKAEERIV